MLSSTTEERVIQRRSRTLERPIHELDKVLQPSFQRLPSAEHVQLIKEDLIREKEKFVEVEPMGVLVIGICQDQRFIIDGQHRLQAYRELGFPKYVVVQEWKFDLFDDMYQHFFRLNQHVPVEDYVLVPKSVVTKSACDKLLTYIEKEYKYFLSKSLNPNFPNINLQNFRNLIPYFPGYEDFTENNVIENFEAFNSQCRDRLLKSKDREDVTRVTKVDVLLKDKTVKRGLFINRALKNLAHKKIEQP